MKYCPIIKDTCREDCIFGAFDKWKKSVCVLSEVAWDTYFKNRGIEVEEKTLWDNKEIEVES